MKPKKKGNFSKENLHQKIKKNLNLQAFSSIDNEINYIIQKTFDVAYQQGRKDAVEEIFKELEKDPNGVGNIFLSRAWVILGRRVNRRKKQNLIINMFHEMVYELKQKLEEKPCSKA